LPPPPPSTLPARPPDIGSAFQPDLPSNARINLERTSCMGHCPVYTLGIKSDGSVFYFGEMNVRVRGPQTKKIDSSAARRFIREVLGSGFLSWKDRYETEGTDLPGANITLTVGATKKTIDDYGPGFHREWQGAESEVRGKLEALEVRADAVAQSAGWVTCPGEERGQCLY
jgi:hypothetical protein